MRALNEQASKILMALLSINQTKIDNSNGLYMPVCIEVIQKTAKYRLISLAHYGEQNDDPMRNPEVIFAEDNGNYIPCHYRNDYLGIETNSVVIENGELVLLDAGIQADLTDLCNQWLLNIKEQQGL